MEYTYFCKCDKYIHSYGNIPIEQGQHYIFVEITQRLFAYELQLYDQQYISH